MSVLINRRDWISAGTLSFLASGAIDQSQSVTQAADGLARFGTAKSCVIVFLFGGQGQQDTYDLKPNAPSEIRGEFSPTSTNVVGTQICEHLPSMAKIMDKSTIIRSMSHADFEHGSASYTALTGHPHPLPGTNTPARKEDFPTYGAVVARLKPTERPVPSAAVLGPVMHQGNRPPMAGQNAGFLGQAFEPFRVDKDPNAQDFAVNELALPSEINAGRFDSRYDLLSRLERRLPAVDRDGEIQGMSDLKRRAFGLLGSGRSRQAFDLNREAPVLRDTYGRHKFGQTLLLARRLVEAEVPLITVNWARSNREEWDTHAKNYPTMKDKLLPPFDQGLAAFISDLDDRGLLDSTMVIALGEFGRTPRINKDAGRDHWPDVYSVLVAGGGVKRGAIVGASDQHAAFPMTDPIGPWDLAATMYHLLGVPSKTHLVDRSGRPYSLTPGRVITDLLS
jgi:hypothetical protein